MTRNLASALVMAVTMAATTAWAQGQPPAPANDMQALRAAVKADKKALVAKTLELTPAEAAKFWPIYDTYQRSLNASNRQKTSGVAFGESPPIRTARRKTAKESQHRTAC